MLLRYAAIGAVAILLATAALAAPADVASQVEEGATMTVLRGQVAVVRPDGSAIQPAPSGTVVNVGDEIRTLPRSDALITFYTATELEMGQDSVLVVERASSRDGRVEVSLKQVFGSTLNRVASFSVPGSTYRIDAGGAVALVRGSPAMEFLIVGPVTTPSGIIVFIICLANCSPELTFAGCRLTPFTWIAIEVERDKVVSRCLFGSVDRRAGFFDTLDDALTAATQAFKGDERGIPPGQQTPNDEDDDGDDDDNTPVIPDATATPTATGTVAQSATPTPTPTPEDEICD